MEYTADSIKLLLRSIKRGPVHDWGQNFLLDQEVVEKIGAAAEIGEVAKSGADPAGRQILEIGPGLGILTAELLKRLDGEGQLVAVEKDRDLAERLPQLLGSPKILKVVPTDVLQFDRAAWFKDGEYLLVANLPFGITNYVLKSFLTEAPRPKRLVLMVQKEVAARVLAEAGDSARGLMSILAEYYADRSLVCPVPKTAFWPVPEVDAAVIKLEIKQPLAEGDERFFKFVKNVFAGRRKTLLNTLGMATGRRRGQVANLLANCQIDPRRRPQELTLAEWQALYQNHANKPLIKADFAV